MNYPFKLIDETGQSQTPIADARIWDWLHPKSVVLEPHAGSGALSCLISKRLLSSKTHVAVGHVQSLSTNRDKNHLFYQVSEPMSFWAIQQKFGLTFTCLVYPTEEFLKTNLPYIGQFDTIFVKPVVDLSAYGFVEVADAVWKKGDLSPPIDLDGLPHFGFSYGVDEKNLRIDHTTLERDEQKDAWKHVPHDATVLELGGRYGTVSCVISKKLADPTRHVAIECDQSVISILERNREANGGQFNIEYGYISNKPGRIIYNHLGTRCVESDSGEVPTLSFWQLQKKYNCVFDCLIADIEGGMERFVRDNKGYLGQFKMIYYEQDEPSHCNYEYVKQTLHELGFKCVKHGFHTLYVR